MKERKTAARFSALFLVVYMTALFCSGNSNRFYGGSFDGYATRSFLQADPGDVRETNSCYSGGAHDGYTQKYFLQSDAGDTVVTNSCYSGGAYDGYAQRYYLQSDAGDTVVTNSCYSGGAYDGSAQRYFLQSDAGDTVVTNSCYSGGAFDGYAQRYFLQSDAGDTVASNYCYSGGSHDGYTYRRFIQSDAGDTVVSNYCYSGGAFDGYSMDYYQYPVPFVEITNAPVYRLYSQTTAWIYGTNNTNISGQLGWINSRYPGVTNWFDQGFFVEISGLAEGSNTITVLAPNILGIFARDSVTIYRETFGDVHPFIDITNAPPVIPFTHTTAEISGTNLNIAGQLGWVNDRHVEATNWFVAGFATTINNLEYGDNIITVFGTNIYHHTTNDTAVIHRETFAEVHPFIDITNAPPVIPYPMTKAEISGTNLNVAGQLGWVNNQHSDTTNWFVAGFVTTINNLEYGNNQITVLGTNRYGHATNDTIAIHRETFAEVHPFIDITNAPEVVAYPLTTAEISGTNLNIAGQLGWVNNQHTETTNWFDSGFAATINNLEYDNNLITVFGTNQYGLVTNDTITIHRETFAEVHPFIDITNAPAVMAYPMTTAEISGTNLNIAGQLGWVNKQHSDTTNWFDQGFSTIVDNLVTGENFITVFGTNQYSLSTNAVVTIRRKTIYESQPQIATNALIFPSAHSELYAGDVTNIIWLVDGITDDIDGTNVTITKITFQIKGASNDTGVVTNDISNILGQTGWLVPEMLSDSGSNYVITFEVVDSSALTNSMIFMYNEFTIVPEPRIIFLMLISAFSLSFFKQQ